MHTTSRRATITTAATELFAQHGFAAVGMRAIADAVGIRPSSLYHHFPSKLDLLYAIALESTQDFVETQLPLVADEPSEAARIRRLLHAHIIYFHVHRQSEAVALRELQELRANAPERYATIQSIRRSYQTALEQMIRDGVAGGEFSCDDPHLAALAILGMVNTVNDWFSDRGAYTIEEVAQRYTDLAVTRILGARRPVRRRGSGAARA
jgi:AcrR family transcriptional regulator